MVGIGAVTGGEEAKNWEVLNESCRRRNRLQEPPVAAEKEEEPWRNYDVAAAA